MKICKTDKSTIVTYLVVMVVALGLSCIGFAFETPYTYYPLVVTAISFVCGLIYLVALLMSAKKKVEVTESNKSLLIAGQMGGNFLRFAIMVIAVLCSFLFIHFAPADGEKDKWVYALVLIAGIPMIVDIALIYLRSAYVE